MNEATRLFDLNVIHTTPWARNSTRAPLRLPHVNWRNFASALCMWAGVLAFAMAMVALRLSLYVQAVVTSRSAVLATLALGVLGVLAFFASHWLGQRDAHLPGTR
jgi:hypothetical protein